MHGHKHSAESGFSSAKVGNIMLGIFLLFVLVLHGVSGVENDRVTVKEGDSVTLHTNVKINQKDTIKWFFKNSRIAQIIGNISICTDVQCKDGDERFRDRLKLDHQTGSLTISDFQHSDSGLYELQIIKSISNTDSLKIFNVTVSGVSAAERDEKRKSVKEGKSVTLDPGVIKKTNDLITWYFNDIVIAEISGDQSKICTDVQCTGRFRDRLKLDHQTGSLTITNITHTDSGEYNLEIIISSSDSFTIRRNKSFSVTVTGPNSAAHAGIVVLVLVVVSAAVAAAVIYYRKNHKTQATREGTRTPPYHNNKEISLLMENSDNGTIPNQTVPVMENADNGTIPNQTEPLMENAANGTTSNQTEPLMENAANGTTSNQTEPLMENAANGTTSNQTEPLMENADNGSVNGSVDCFVNMKI